MSLVSEKYNFDVYSTNKSENERVISELINELKNKTFMKIVLFLSTRNIEQNEENAQDRKIRRLYCDDIKAYINDVYVTVPFSEIADVPIKISDIEISVYCINHYFVLIKPVFGLKNISYDNDNAIITYCLDDCDTLLIEDAQIESIMPIEGAVVTKTIYFDDKGWFEEQNISVTAKLVDAKSAPIKLHVTVHLTDEYAEEYDCLLNVSVHNPQLETEKNARILTYVFKM
mgnify:CR=1 FL=1